MKTEAINRELLARGFDHSIGRTVRCSQCAALVINGVAVHERGCPNEIHECRGCNATVARPGAYCQDCQ